MIHVLIDFDNIEGLFKPRSLRQLADRLLSKFDYGTLKSDPSIKLKLYGGWYLEKRPTRLAQELVAQSLSDFSFTRSVSDPRGALTVDVHCELAYSLLLDPGRHLFYTYRQRGIPNHLKSDAPSTKGCTVTVCPIEPISRFINSGTCPEAGCSIIPDSLLYRGEQKLVDTMLTSDLIHLAKSGAPVIAIASSDDDLWPGIRTAVLYGATVIHIHVKVGHRTPGHYAFGMGSRYIQKAL